MIKKSVFSNEYEINNTTESQSAIQEQSSAPKDKDKNEFIKKIESDYNLSKPRRKLIRARIISK